MTTVRKRLIQEPERVNPVESVHIWQTPAGSPVDMIIVAHLSAYSDIHRQATSSLPNETGGFLIGRVACDQRGCWHVEIEQAVPVEPVTQNPVHFTFTWRDVDRVRNFREEQGKALLGWYHTHPDLGIFLSETDLERTHRVLFSEPFQIALVYDPVRGRAGYFFWEGAQQITVGHADWREFDILVPPSPTAASGESMPIVSAPLPSSPTPANPTPVAPAGTTTTAPAAPEAMPVPAQHLSDQPTQPPPVTSPPGQPLVAARSPVPESEIPTTPGAFPAITDTMIAREVTRLSVDHLKQTVEPTRTQRLRQPDTGHGSVVPGADRSSPVRDTADPPADDGTRVRGVVILAGVVLLVAVVTLILWLSAN